jgi:lipopolysaccharide transport system permease protein
MSIAINLNAGERRRWQHARDLLTVLVERDLKILYKRSSLGFGWALVTPLVQLLIFSFIFHRVLAIEIKNYASFVFIGVLVFGWFQTSLGQSSAMITGNRALVTQPGFPLTLLPHVMVAVRFFHFAIAMPILFALLWSGGIRPGWSWLSLPVLVGVQYLLIVGLSYPLASINVIYRDTQHIVGVALQMMMFVTPVFYSLEKVMPEQARWFYLNPMVGLLESWRSVLLNNTWPDPRMIGALLTLGIVLLVLGRKLFVRQSHLFAEEL